MASASTKFSAQRTIKQVQFYCKSFHGLQQEIKRNISLLHMEICFSFGRVIVYNRKMFIRRMKKLWILRHVCLVRTTKGNSSSSIISSSKHNNSGISLTSSNDPIFYYFSEQKNIELACRIELT